LQAMSCSIPALAWMLFCLVAKRLTVRGFQIILIKLKTRHGSGRSAAW
jgi:hypothetical protein